MGAWIEMRTGKRNPCRGGVAPLVGAWIEIVEMQLNENKQTSLPLWERGLKFTGIEKSDDLYGVAPLVGAWIEITLRSTIKKQYRSLPLWERGLKFKINKPRYKKCSRSPCGSVD